MTSSSGNLRRKAPLVNRLIISCLMVAGLVRALLQHLPLSKKAIWKNKSALPRVKMLVWRSVVGAIPVLATISTRIRDMEPSCPICSMQHEIVEHVMLQCSLARATWFSSKLPLKSGTTDTCLDQWIVALAKDLDDKALAYCFNILWSLWNSKNQYVFKGSEPTLVQVLNAANKIALHRIKTATSSASISSLPTDVYQSLPVSRGSLEEKPENAKTLWVDASWGGSFVGGVGLLEVNSDGSLACGSFVCLEFCPNVLYGEAKVVLLGLQNLLPKDVNTTTPVWIFSNSLSLIKILLGVVDLEDWSIKPPNR